MSKLCKEPLRFYIAGPICPRGDVSLHDASRVMKHHVDDAISIAISLIDKGHYIYIPHLDYYVHIHHTAKKDYGTYWYLLGVTFLESWANAFYYISSSPGTDMERELAEKLRMPIFYSLEEVPIVKNPPKWHGNEKVE